MTHPDLQYNNYTLVPTYEDQRTYDDKKEEWDFAQYAVKTLSIHILRMQNYF